MTDFSNNNLTQSAVETVVAYWPMIHGDPELLDGLTFGQADDLMGATITLASETKAVRDVPLAVILRLQRSEGIADIGAAMQELMRVKVIREMLDEIVRQDVE